MGKKLKKQQEKLKKRRERFVPKSVSGKLATKQPGSMNPKKT